jgi:hypothetical protein
MRSIGVGSWVASALLTLSVLNASCRKDGVRERTYTLRVPVDIQRPPNECLEAELRRRYGEARLSSDENRFTGAESFGRGYYVRLPLQSINPMGTETYAVVAFVKWDRPYLEISSSWVGLEMDARYQGKLRAELSAAVSQILLQCHVTRTPNVRNSCDTFPEGERCPSLDESSTPDASDAARVPSQPG